MSNIHVVSASYSQVSRTRELAQALASSFRSLGANITYVDLRDLDKAFCVSDNEGSIDNYPPCLKKIYGDLSLSDALLLVSPVFLYSVSGGAKNFLDIVGDAIEGRPFGLATTSGSKRSHLACADLQKAMMFEYACPIFPCTLQFTSDDSLRESNFDSRVQNYCEDFVGYVDLYKNYKLEGETL